MKDRTVEFGRELEAYEREMTGRVGAFAAREARREMGAHLEADLAARIEMGIEPEAARGQALAAFGDPQRIARGEGRNWRSVLLFLTPCLVLLGRDLASETTAIVGVGSGLLALLGPGTVAGFVSGLRQRRLRWEAGVLGWIFFCFVASLFPSSIEAGEFRVGPLGLLLYGGGMFVREDLLSGGAVFGALALPFVAHVLAVRMGRWASPAPSEDGRAAGWARGIAPVAYVRAAILGGAFAQGAGLALGGGLLLFGSWSLRRPDARAAAWGAGLAGLLIFRANLVQYGGRMSPLDPGNTFWGVGLLFVVSLFVQTLVVGLRRLASSGSREASRG